MNDTEFRQSLRTAMSATQAPPPMSPAAMLDKARKAQQRRHGLMAGGAAAAAVAAITVGAVVVGGSDDAPPPGIGVGGAPQQSVNDTKPNWPSGQTDASARSGPQFQQSAVLLDAAAAVAPDGYSTDDVPLHNPDHVGPLRSHQSQVTLGRDNAVTGWEYQAQQPLTKDGRTGLLMVLVQTPGANPTADPCTFAPDLWSMGGDCHIVQSGGKAVGVVTGGKDEFDQYAAYQYPDGTVVWVAQTKAAYPPDLPSLPADPYTADELAALTLTPSFHLNK